MSLPLVAVDIGNTRYKFGLFFDLSSAGSEHGTVPPAPACSTGSLPVPRATCDCSVDGVGLDGLAAWLSQHGAAGARWWIGSVNRAATTRLVDWLAHNRPGEVPMLLSARDLPLAVELPQPDRVGIDRLLDVVGANALRTPGCPAIVVDLGTAITVNRVSASGAFQGGAILPGIGLSAKALHEFTDLLPLVQFSENAPPPAALGTNTVEAMTSGLYYGALGAIREIIARLSEGEARALELFFTGGAAPAVVGRLNPGARHVPHLTLGGIALAAASRAR